MDLRRVCFFCNQIIESKKTLEHIIPNSLLGKLGIKESVLTGRNETQYSRIKVPAHSNCNSEFGSEYENRVLDLLGDFDSLYDVIIAEESSSPDEVWSRVLSFGNYYYMVIKNLLWALLL